MLNHYNPFSFSLSFFITYHKFLGSALLREVDDYSDDLSVSFSH